MCHLSALNRFKFTQQTVYLISKNKRTKGAHSHETRKQDTSLRGPFLPSGCCWCWELTQHLLAAYIGVLYDVSVVIVVGKRRWNCSRRRYNFHTGGRYRRGRRCRRRLLLYAPPRFLRWCNTQSHIGVAFRRECESTHTPESLHNKTLIPEDDAGEHVPSFSWRHIVSSGLSAHL